MGTRIAAQDWSTLTLEAFPASSAQITQRSVVERSTTAAAARTHISMETDHQETARLVIGAPSDNSVRAWLVRLHLLTGQEVKAINVDGTSVQAAQHLQPISSEDHFPLSGIGAHPGPKAGPIVEIRVPLGGGARTVVAQVRQSNLNEFM